MKNIMMISVLLCCILMMFLYYVQHGKQQKLLNLLTYNMTLSKKRAVTPLCCLP